MFKIVSALVVLLALAAVSLTLKIKVSNAATTPIISGSPVILLNR